MTRSVPCRPCPSPRRLVALCSAVLLLLLAVSWLLLVYAETYTHQTYTLQPKHDFVTFYNGSTGPFPVNSSVRVQFVTRYFGRWGQRSNVANDYLSSGCHWRCTFSYGATIKSESDVLVFHAWDLRRHPESIPAHAQRSARQLWVLENGESPWLTTLDMRRYNHVFNWTAFVRQDSDTPSTFSYGRIRKRESTRHAPNVTVKQKHVYWMVSNCMAVNHRDSYVDSLRSHLTVDIYGGTTCHPDVTPCPKGSAKCDQLAEEYNFYLAFENANCRDYITEKFWRSLRTGVIPVVMGDSEGYRKVAPPGSYIDVADFRSPKELAQYLLQVRNVVVIIGQRWS